MRRHQDIGAVPVMGKTGVPVLGTVVLGKILGILPVGTDNWVQHKTDTKAFEVAMGKKAETGIEAFQELADTLVGVVAGTLAFEVLGNVEVGAGIVASQVLADKLVVAVVGIEASVVQDNAVEGVDRNLVLLVDRTLVFDVVSRTLVLMVVGRTLVFRTGEQGKQELVFQELEHILASRRSGKFALDLGTAQGSAFLAEALMVFQVLVVVAVVFPNLALPTIAVAFPSLGNLVWTLELGVGCKMASPVLATTR